MNRIFLYIVIAFIFFNTTHAQDLDKFTDRLQQQAIETTDTSGVNEFQQKMQSNGSWEDVDYNNTSRTLWKPLEHLTRLKKMAVAWQLIDDPQLLTAISKGLDFWFDRKPVSDNWWYNDIGQILQLGPLVVLLKGELTQNQVKSSAEILEEPTRSSVRTGQNLVWISAGSIYRGALIDSVQLINYALNNITGTIEITDKEGIKSDFSFHQHGPQLYNGSYGYSFMGDVVKWAWLTRDLEFQFDPEKIKILTSLMLDGTRWMTFRDWMDIAPRGRAFTRPGSGDLKNSIDLLQLMKNVDPARSAQFEQMIRFIRKGGENPLIGNKFFWESDFMVQQAPLHYFSVRMSSDETVGTEVINSENLKGFWLPFGTHWLVRHTEEYEPVIYAMDWAHLPGLTAPDTSIVIKNGYISQEENLVGGVSTGLAGLAFFTLNKEQTRARKVWMTWGDEILVMAAGITSEHVKPVHSTFNQVLKKGMVSVDGKQLEPGMHAFDKVKWLWHDSVGYILDQPAAVTVVNRSQGGSMYSINQSYSQDTVIKPVFKAWIDHGLKPENDSYIYRILPVQGLSSMSEKVNGNGWQVGANSQQYQSAWNPEQEAGGLVAWQPGSYQLQHYNLTLNQPAAIILEEGRRLLYIASALDGPLEIILKKGDQTLLKKNIYLNNGKTIGISF